MFKRILIFVLLILAVIGLLIIAWAVTHIKLCEFISVGVGISIFIYCLWQLAGVLTEKD